MIEATFDASLAMKQFDNIEYNKLRNAFAEGIAQSLNILKEKTLSNLAATGVNINGPFRKRNGKSGYVTYSPLKDGVAMEVANTGDVGRVRIAPASRQSDNGYYTKMQFAHFALKWFEWGTQDRYKEQDVTYEWKSNSNKKQGGARKHKVVGKKVWTGKVKATPFFNPAIEETRNAVNSTLQKNITDAINKAFNT